MLILHRVDTHHKLYASLALILCLSMGISLWLLGQLDQLSTFTGDVDHKLRAGAAQAQAGIAGVRMLAWLAMGLTVGAALMLALWLRAEITRPLEAATAMARRVANGDLSGHIAERGAGASGQLLATMQEMNDALASMIVKVRTGTERMAGSAGQVAAGSMALSARTEEQADSIKQTAASVEQLSATVRHTIAHARQARELAGSSSDVASEGGAVMADLVGTMAGLAHSARRIGDIIGTIDAIACQTNILALNAAVEAARAGDQGRGFAVVAAEVRSLAQRSADAAREITLVINDALQQVGAGNLLAAKAVNTMHEVATGVTQVSGIIGAIADASARQAAGMVQVNYAIAAMDRATQHNATLVEHTAAAATSMREQAASLSRTTAVFVLGPEYGPRQPMLHLVSNNPNQALPAGGTATRSTTSPMHVVLARAPVSMRGRHAAAAPGTDWEQF